MWQNLITERTSNIEFLGHDITRWLDQHLVNILIILIGTWFLRKFGTKLVTQVIHKTVRKDMYPTDTDRKKRIKTLDGLVGAIVRVVAWMIAVFMIINELGINTAPLLASAGVLGLAIGFGAQSLVKDFVSGVFIITEHQYRVGDYISIGTVSGTVEAITIRTTIIRDLDGNVHHVPNGTITVTTNKTNGFSRINEVIIVNHDTPVDLLEHVINHVGEEMTNSPDFKDVIQEQPKFIRLDGFSTDGMRVIVRGQTVDGEQWRVKGELYRRLAKAFEKNDIEIPHQQVDVHQIAKKSKS
jgi:small-conductance mechanosensitive channel